MTARKLNVVIEVTDEEGYLSEEYWRDHVSDFIYESIDEASAVNHEPVEWKVISTEWLTPVNPVVSFVLGENVRAGEALDVGSDGKFYRASNQGYMVIAPTDGKAGDIFMVEKNL